MERLTFEGNFCDIAKCRDSACKQDGTCTQKEVWKRLKAYEDTGLIPEKVSWMKEVVEAAFDNDTSRIERAHNLHVADKEGRCVVLPCKLGTKVYRIRYEIADYPDDPELEIATTWFTPEYRDDIGKTVFLTREEAEKALQEMEDKKDD